MNTNDSRIEILWFVPDCGYLHAGEDAPNGTIPAHCPENVTPPAVEPEEERA